MQTNVDELREVRESLREMTEEPDNHIVIGIDPGSKTGLAVWRPKIQKFEDVTAGKIHDIMNRVYILAFEAACNKARIVLFCENPNTFVPFKGNNSFKATAQGAGSIKRDFAIWRDFCEEHEIPFIPVRLQKHQKKMTAEEFQKLTGYEHRTNVHGRDAAMMVWKKNIDDE